MTVIHPVTVAEAQTYRGEYRAGGTDVEARRRIGLTQPVTIDLRRVPGLDGIDVRDDATTRVGSMVRIVEVAGLTRYPAFAATAAALANPHTRAAATVGGNLLQQTRCWYYRTGQVDCHKTGGAGCPARLGLHHFGNVFDTSSCVAPHPSSLAMALLVYDAEVEVDPGGLRPVGELYDVVDPSSEHRLENGEVLTGIVLPPPIAGERASYRRATSRALAEWPIVEAVCALTLGDDGEIADLRVGVGGVGPVPRRLPLVEERLRGAVPGPDAVAAAAALATEGARPAPQAAVKLPLLEGIVAEVIEQAVAGDNATELAFHEATN